MKNMAKGKEPKGTGTKAQEPAPQEQVYVVLRAGIANASFPFPLPPEKLDLTLSGLLTYAGSPEVNRSRDDEAVLGQIRDNMYGAHGMTANGKAVKANEKVRALIGPLSVDDGQGGKAQFTGLELVVARDESGGTSHSIYQL